MNRTYLFLIAAVLSCFTLLTGASPSWAASAMGGATGVQSVQTLEETLFAIHYDQDTLDARVGRLEETVFGQAQTGPLDGRIARLQSALSPGSLGPLSPTAKKPVASAAANPPAAGKPVGKPPLNGNPAAPVSSNASFPAAPGRLNTPNAQAAVSPAPGETDYPTVSQMELKLFQKTFVQEDITLRLARLEKEVFKTPQSGALADRVDNLRLVVLGDTGATAPNVANSSYGGGYGPPPRYTQAPPSGGYGYGPSAYTGSSPGSSPYQPSPYQPYNGAGYPQTPSYGNNGMGGYNGTPIAYSPTTGYGQPNPGVYQPNAYGEPAAYNGGSPYGNSSYQASPGGASGGQPTPDVLAAMDEVEKSVLGHTYPSEPMNARLDRVETKVFKSTSPEMGTEDRLQRVIAVSSAGGAPESARSRAKSTFQTLLPIILTILPMVLL